MQHLIHPHSKGHSLCVQVSVNAVILLFQMCSSNSSFLVNPTNDCFKVLLSRCGEVKKWTQHCWICGNICWPGFGAVAMLMKSRPMSRGTQAEEDCGLVVNCNRAAPDASSFLKGRRACRVEWWFTLIADDQHGLRLIKLVVSRFLAGFGSSYWNNHQCRASPGSRCVCWCPAWTTWMTPRQIKTSRIHKLCTVSIFTSNDFCSNQNLQLFLKSDQVKPNTSTSLYRVDS